MKRVVTSRMVWGIIAGWALQFGSLDVQAQYPDGIYAEFETSMGNFTNRLEYELAPKAAANFIGLATGERAWLDLPSGLVKTNPYYNGTTFHRVIAGFMIQGGSPNGMGTDGPGYDFIDEFDPSLRHDSFGIMSSANSGPDSNGSQFFVTVGPTPWLDDVHTVFGKLYGGSNIVYAINNVATGTSDKPLTNVVVNSVSIRRVGAAAQAFDIHAQGLPVVTDLNANLALTGTNIALSFSNRVDVENWLYSSTNLTDWTANFLGIEIISAATNPIVRAANAQQEFFRLAQVQHATSLYVPSSVANKTVTLKFSAFNGTVTCHFNGSGSGNYSWSIGAPGSITAYNYTQDAYRGRLRPIVFSGIYPMNLHLDFDSATAGTFKGSALPNYPSEAGSFSVSGTFTATP